MKHVFMLLVIGAVMSAALCAPMQQSSDESVVSRKKRSEKANTVALIQALAKLQDMAEQEDLDFADEQEEEEDDDTLVAAIESLPEEAQTQFWSALLPVVGSLVSNLIRGRKG